MSGILGYSTCRIQFVPNNRQHGERNYSDRSIVELRERDFGNIILQALDIENNKARIFDIRLGKEDQYKYGQSDNNPDEIRTKDGTYRLWLKKDSRDNFHKELHKCYQQVSLASQPDTDSDKPDRNDEDNDVSDDNIHVMLNQPEPDAVSAKDLLLNVHQLGRYIEDGDIKSATRIASDLASKGVRLQAQSSENARNEKEFTIQVQIDGNEYGVGQQGPKIPVGVFQSTTIRELRATFELVYHYPPTNQYFFANGRLAYDSLTMKQLKVGPNSLFVLFLLTHSRSFQRTGPWRCQECTTNNQQDNLRCKSCSAARRD